MHVVHGGGDIHACIGIKKKFKPNIHTFSIALELKANTGASPAHHVISIQGYEEGELWGHVIPCCCVQLLVQEMGRESYRIM